METMTCPLCGSESKVAESRKFLDGGRRTRRWCLNEKCNHRWTITTRGATPSFVKELLTAEQIAFLLTRRDLNNSQAGKLVNRTVNCVRAIRYGRTYPDVCPEIPRWESPVKVIEGPQCCQCVHWSKKAKNCDMEFPEAKWKSGAFAKECNTFLLRE